ncbi:MAG: OmpA family protein [Gammaproteobacteria bacterium]
MKKLLIVALATTLFSAPQHIANADEMIEAGRWYLTPMGSYVFREDKSRFSNTGAGAHLGLARGLGNNWALEVNVFGNRLEGDTLHDIGQYGLGLDLIRAFDTGGKWSPYAVVGTGYMKTRSDESNNIPPNGADSDNAIGTAALGLAHPVGNSSGMFRTEVRYRADFADTDDYSDLIFNIGVTVPLGPTAAPPVILDSDNDGVVDPEDLCSGTPAGAAVDATGCELDSDKDGVKNSRDKCPATKMGVKVDSMGCEMMRDADGDGVADSKDRCPRTPKGTKVDARGCKVIGDDDGDGVLNNIDQCPNTAKGVRIDARGCEIRDEIQLPGVEFELNSAKLTPTSLSILSGAVDTLNRYSDITVQAEGHTDSSGAASYNMNLSQQRAESVRDYIIGQGIDASRITARGFGETSPIADNSNAAGRQANRRVTLRLTSE